ncbi:MAG: hypothetical protein WAL47_07820 [Pyrinomonadaceae bacterium]
MQFLTIRISLLKQLKFLLVAAFLAVPAATTQAQVSSVRISVLSLSPAKVAVELEGPGYSDWSFRNTYTSVVGLADRIENFQGQESQGRNVLVRKLAPGQFRFAEKVMRVSYEVLLTPPTNLGNLSHASWLNKEHGLLMLGDLLPDSAVGETPTLNLDFELPTGWTTASSRDAVGERYTVSHPEQAVFLVGTSLHSKTTRVGTAEIKIVTVGDWPFGDNTLSKIVAKIVDEYARVLRHPPPAKVGLLLLPFSGAVGPERWSAETRGQNVVLLMGKQAKSGAVLARLKVVLAHELFHLWIPNSLKLKGDYDWFFEGFTLYQALLTGLRLHYITFDEYLETLSRVYDSYRSSIERDKLSLLDASERRWTAAASLVYDKGALVALIYDLMLRRNSAGRETLTDVYPELLQAGQGSRQDANELLIGLLNKRAPMERFGEKFVEGKTEIDLASILAPFGLEVATGSSSRIQVSKNVDKEQKRLLKTLGYKS